MKFILLPVLSLTCAGCLHVDDPQKEGIPEYTRQMDLSGWSIKTTSINVWALWHFSKYTKERMPVIGQVLRESSSDFAFIQEAWKGDAQKTLKETAKFPYTRYYDVSHTVGSGLMSFSNYAFDRRSFRPFIMLGPLSEFYEGEVLSGKGVSMDTIKVKGLPISMFNTHTISRYREQDAYTWEDKHTPDRLMAMFEIFEHIVEQTDSDAFIVAGDFNMNYAHVEYWTWLKLTSLDGNRFEEFDHVTCTSCDDNTNQPGGNHGQIDFVFVSPRLKIQNSVLEFKKQMVPVENGEKWVNLSDHYGWVTQVVPQAVSKDPSEVRRNTTEAISFINDRLEKYLEENKDSLSAQGIEDHICYVCNIEDSIEDTQFYLDVLNGQNTGATGQIIKRRLESYFQIFR